MTDAAVCNERSRGRVRAQRGGPRNRCTVDYASTRNVEIPQHLIEQRRISSCACGVERVQETILENIHAIERNCVPEFRAFACDIGRTQRHAAGELTLYLKVEVLNVGRHPVVRRALHDVVPDAVQWNRLERRILQRYRQ